MFPLDFQRFLLLGSARAASRLQLAKQRRQIVFICRQTTDNRDELALLAFPIGGGGGLLRGRRLDVGGGGPGTILVRLATPISMRQSIPLGSLKQSHAGLTD